MGLFPAVFLHDRVGVHLRYGHCQAVERHGTQPVLLASRPGIRRVLGSGYIAGRSLSRSPIGPKDGGNTEETRAETCHIHARRRGRDCGLRALLALHGPTVDP